MIHFASQITLFSTISSHNLLPCNNLAQKYNPLRAPWLFALWLDEVVLPCNHCLQWHSRIGFVGKNGVTNKGIKTKFGTILLCFSAGYCIADINVAVGV